MKPSIPNQKKAYNALNSRLSKYMAQVQSIYDRIANQVAIAVEGVDYDGSIEFKFSDYPEFQQTTRNIMMGYTSQMNSLIYSGTSREWKESNLMQDLLARKVLRAYDFEKGGDKYNRYFQPNSEALKAFQSRVDNGINLSQRLWNQSQNLIRELEQTISTAIDKGQSAVVLSKRISKYLNDFPSLKEDYGEKFGKAINCRDCHYSSMRLARTEINMAYRKAEQLRWQQFDFILGYEVKLSNRHPAPDICDDLFGKYPKDFVFLGWHPNCMCYVVPIIMSDEQYYGGDDIKKDGMIVRTPKSFNDWVRSNKMRIENATTLPYFLRDNRKYWHLSVEDAAKYRHDDRNDDAIRLAWNNRKLIKKGYEIDDKEISSLRRYAKAYNVDISPLEKYLSTHKFDEDLGEMTNSQEKKLSDMVDKYNEKIAQSAMGFNSYRDSFWKKFDYSYDFGDWKKQVLNRFSSIKPTLFNTSKDLKPQIKLLYEEAKRELQELRTIPLNPKKIIDSFDSFDFDTAMTEREKVMAGKTMLENLYGKNLDFNPIWNQILGAVKSEGWGKGYELFLDEYEHKGLKEVLMSATHLNDLMSADLSVIPLRWVPRFNDYIKTIESAKIDVRGYERVYREIEGAYNIWKLSTDKDLIEYGLNKLSFNTPYAIVDGFRSIGMGPTKWLGKKEFYDSFDKFVPCINLNVQSAYYNSKYDHIAIDFEGLKDRLEHSKWFRRSVQYHEYGHAKANLQGDWENKEDFKKLFQKYYDDYNRSSNYYEYTDLLGNKEIRWKLKDRYKDTKLKYESHTKDIEEQFGSVADTLQSLSKDKKRLDTFGHIDYFELSDYLCITEIIAHLSESYWIKNKYFRELLPKFYDEAIQIYEEYLKRNLPKKR